MNKILYIIPGYMNDAFGPIGTTLAKQALKSGIIPVPVTIDWKGKNNGKVFKDYVAQFFKV